MGQMVKVDDLEGHGHEPASIDGVDSLNNGPDMSLVEGLARGIRVELLVQFCRAAPGDKLVDSSGGAPVVDKRKYHLPRTRAPDPCGTRSTY